ncbi:Hypothetical_protein [Hexamita inflata]|uniref:Hypothetical_protein n=1 Tax=Hexamita inflata TaxID=28002 RepID=A0AA86V0S4_9EUKA|nr:Hypothetical protein HINF_LOCUS41898 [Hexamita inflata]
MNLKLQKQMDRFGFSVEHFDPIDPSEFFQLIKQITAEIPPMIMNVAKLNNETSLRNHLNEQIRFTSKLQKQLQKVIEETNLMFNQKLDKKVKINDQQKQIKELLDRYINKSLDDDPLMSLKNYLLQKKKQIYSGKREEIQGVFDQIDYLEQELEQLDVQNNDFQSLENHITNLQLKNRKKIQNLDQEHLNLQKQLNLYQGQVIPLKNLQERLKIDLNLEQRTVRRLITNYETQLKELSTNNNIKAKQLIEEYEIRTNTRTFSATLRKHSKEIDNLLYEIEEAEEQDQYMDQALKYAERKNIAQETLFKEAEIELAKIQQQVNEIEVKVTQNDIVRLTQQFLNTISYQQSQIKNLELKMTKKEIVYDVARLDGSIYNRLRLGRSRIEDEQ